MHLRFIWLYTLFLVYLLEFLIKTRLIHLINIIIVICYLHFLDFAYEFITLKRLIPMCQSCNCYSVATPLFLISFICIFNFTTLNASQNGFNRKFITIVSIRDMQLLLIMIKFYLSKVPMDLNMFAFIADLFHDICCSANANTSYVFHVSENIKDINLWLKQFVIVQFARNFAV